MENLTNSQSSGIALQNKKNGLRDFLGPVLILSSIFAVNFTARVILAPLLPVIKSDLGLSHAGAGSLFLLISFGYFISLIGSSLITAYITHKRTIVFSGLALGMALMLTSASLGLWGIRLALVFVGVAAGPYIASGIATLTTLVHSKHWGKVLAIHELAPNLGFVMAPLIAEAALLGFSWRSSFLSLGTVAIVLSGIFILFGRGGEFRGEIPSLKSYKTVLSSPNFWILVILFSLGIGSVFGIFSMLPLYLVTEHGLERHWANTLTSLSRIASIGVVFAGGWAVDRYGAKKILTIVVAVTGGLTAGLGISPTSWVVAIIFLQPAVAACFFPAALAALSMVSPPKEKNIVVSLTIPLSYMIGGGAFPALIGLIGDINSISSGMVLLGILTITGSLLPHHLKFCKQS